jgi:hypothetical protein
MRVKKTQRSNGTKKEKKKKSLRSKKGGKAIDAGSYGCVFIPPLKCEDKNIPYISNNISKLMFNRDAKSEFEEINKIKQYIKNIPNKEDYFLLDNTQICKPDVIDKKDLESLDRKCKLFTKRGIDENNVNDNLDKLSILNMPNGGISVENFWTKMLKNPNNNSNFVNANKLLIKLLINGIVPLNNNGYNHYDVKAGNILISQDGHVRLIDWGLSGSNDGTTIPEVIQDRSLAFNIPFSDIFFNDFTKKWLPEEYKRLKAAVNFRNKKAGQAELLKIVAVNLINKSIHETSDGHYDYITSNILHDIYKVYSIKNSYNRLDYNVLSYNTLIEYIQAVLIHYVDENGNFNDVKYFYEVFKHNVDVWGFILTYAPIIEEGTDIVHIDIINSLCRILLRYCFSPEFAVKKIDVNELVADLASINLIAMNKTTTMNTKFPSNLYDSINVDNTKIEKNQFTFSSRKKNSVYI